MTGRDRDPFSEDDLHAYVDGQLESDRVSALEAWLEAHPDAAEQVAEWQAQNAGIKALFGAEPPAPRRADEEIVKRLARNQRGPSRAIAAGIALFVVGGLTGAALTNLDLSKSSAYVETLPEASKANYLIYSGEVRHPVEVAANEEQHLVTWLGKRIGRTFSAPDLSSQGYRLVGGRLIPYAGKPGAMLMYENDSGQRMTVMIGTNSSERGTNFRFEEADGVSTFYWIDNGFGFALSAPIGREALLSLAELIYRQE